ncbi:alanine racemase C-terminal domain-containing protein [Marinomonas fungiae]|uniref:alanine racemase C-terminal domain-containing protein n=1 Tax=Marinomonas fungiae TaxID=1137284 RepID=UPI003A8F7902
MDMIIKLSDNDTTNLAIGDEVVLWGDGVPVEHVAHCSKTIGYELVTRMTSRPSRIYLTKD